MIVDFGLEGVLLEELLLFFEPPENFLFVLENLLPLLEVAFHELLIDFRVEGMCHF